MRRLSFTILVALFSLLVLAGALSTGATPRVPKITSPSDDPTECAALQVAPGAAAALARSAPLVLASMSQDFEGSWPATGWSLEDYNSADGGEFLLGKRNCHPHAGSFGGWLVGGGTAGGDLACDADYPQQAETWAIYGPFSLVDATSASLTFYLYGTAEGGSEGTCNYDYLYAGSSVDGQQFSGARYCGDWSDGPDGNGYYHHTLDLGDQLGQSQVWVAFAFISDSSLSYNGYHVDDVSLQVSGGPANTPTPTLTQSPGQTPTPTATVKPAGKRAALPLVAKSQRIPGGVLRNSRGAPATALDRSESLYGNFSGLEPRKQYDVTVLDPSGAELTLSRLTTDNQGQIPITALAYDLGLTVGTQSAVILNQVGRHTVIVSNVGGSEVHRSLLDVREPVGPVIFASDAQGTAQNSFPAQSYWVYARGMGFAPGTQVWLYVVADRRDWQLDMPLANVTGSVHEVAVADNDGKFLVAMWRGSAQVGAYDLVADIDRDGKYSEGDVVDGYTPVGFMVQRLNDGSPIQVQLACDYSINYKDVFAPSENVYAFLNPLVQQLVPHRWVRKYVVVHRDVWATGDPLVDVTEGSERDHPQSGCTNEGRVLVWPAPLTPGVYDVIIDVNVNGTYDVGIDLLDNIDSFGNPVGGFLVPGAAGSPVVTITNPADGSSDPDGVITLEGTVSSATPVTWAKWYVSAGPQSSSGDLTINQGAFSQQVYLFPGVNTVQAWARNAIGIGTASTRVNSAVSGVWDIHAQLVWPVVGQDVDLHLLRPGGARVSNGDCYYSNCDNESRAANPDWGQAGVADDNPRLDIDCTTSCSGPENITLNTQGHPEANGRYTVEVYYYNDHGLGTANPRVNVWIRGQLYTFGPVALTNHQWWTVCSVDWPSGLVTASGVIGASSLASDEGSDNRFPSTGGGKPNR